MTTPTITHAPTGIAFRWHRVPDVTVELFWARDRGVWLHGVGSQGLEPQRGQTPVDLPAPAGDGQDETDDAEAIARAWWGGWT